MQIDELPLYLYHLDVKTLHFHQRSEESDCPQKSINYSPQNCDELFWSTILRELENYLKLLGVFVELRSFFNSSRSIELACVQKQWIGLKLKKACGDLWISMCQIDNHSNESPSTTLFVRVQRTLLLQSTHREPLHLWHIFEFDCTVVTANLTHGY